MRVLLATDGSPEANVAIGLAGAIAWPSGTLIRVLHVIEPDAGLYGEPWPALALVQLRALEAQIRRAARQTVKRGAARLARPGLTVEPVVLEGRPSTVIAEGAERFGADLVILGSPGSTGLDSMLLGSVSAEVIESARVPVLVARGRGLDRVLLAWDGSPSAAHGAECLRSWPIFGQAFVRVVSVADVPISLRGGMPHADTADEVPLHLDALAAARDRCARLAAGMAATLQACGLRADAECREGNASREILAAASAWFAGLIVLGAHGHGALGRLLPGSVARTVARHAACSVLIVHGGPHGVRGADRDAVSDASHAGAGHQG